MHIPEFVLSLILMVSLTFYALLGGADYGSGVWDLLAWGKRERAQRALIANAIAPVWEANHVWLILAVVLLFAGFPVAYAALSTALNIPLSVLLVGIVMRGASFIFRTYHTADYRTQKRWGLIFAISSTITPVCLGVIVGAISSGRVMVVDGISKNGFVAPWLGLYPLTVGIFTLSIFTFLAAVYLTIEARDKALQEDFRRKALGAGSIVALMALATFLAARAAAPELYLRLVNPRWVWLVQVATAAYATTAMVALLRRSYKVARFAAMWQVALILWSWALSQSPYLLEGQLTIRDAAAAPTVLWPLIGATTAGAMVLFPSLGYLIAIFKQGDSDMPLH